MIFTHLITKVVYCSSAKFTFVNGKLTNSDGSDTKGTYKPDNMIERCHNWHQNYNGEKPIKVVGSVDALQGQYDANKNVLTIRKPGLKVVDDWVLGL